MQNRRLLTCFMMFLAVLLAAISLSYGFSVPVKADGGVMPPDPLLFAKLKEGQQVAVVTLKDTSTASVDLFVSILDQSGQSNDVVYFVPLGVKASGFYVQETTSYAFSGLTGRLDGMLYRGFEQDQRYVEYLFAGALLTNGVWLTPLWLPLLLSGCMSAPPPVSTFRTDSSEVNVFEINDGVDIESLVSATGLDPKVTDTLTRLRGQQIAVIKLHTKANGATAGSAAASEPGLHLSWTTSLTPSKSGATYAYPLGTGAAWSQPIELTRVYVVAPLELHVSVQYPELGTNMSGYAQKNHSYEPKIAEAGSAPAYAVAETNDTDIPVIGDLYDSYPKQGRIWRITYANSNSSEDILIAVNTGSTVGLGSVLARAGPSMALLIGMGIAAAFWLLSWFLLMPRLLRVKLRVVWQLSTPFVGWNLILLLPGSIFLILYDYGAQAFAVGGAAVSFAVASLIILVYLLSRLERLGITARQTIKALAIVTLASNGAYLLFVLGYSKLVGAI